ncbi:MAG: selenocysteine-specific translation elongation factor, partial [Epsilonproteobacteria bacterium]|nr:selenocysteine-specific translation elongation factor [Campylobacterota bacterium]
MQYHKRDSAMRNIIVGTAGHIDHGKTALIEAMNGYNGDELEEEKEKGITIDLSFSNMSDGKTNIAFIDVPGHEKLIKNMISGAFGFDVSLFVVDVNEGLMPQSIEHLEVLNFLNLGDIIIALSKCDLASKELIAKREGEIREFIKRYENIRILEIFHTSIKDKNSIEKLKNYLFSLKAKDDIEKESFFRYYVDRVFSVKGFGEVTTGTVLNGEIQKDKRVYICEIDTEAIVKNIQVHSKDTDIATKHQRAALNLNIPHGKIKKGYLFTNKGYFRGFKNIDIFIKNRENFEVKHNQHVQFLYGAKNLTAKITIYSKESEGVYAKASFDEKVYLMHKDRFVLLSNNEVIAGGIVLDPISDPIKKSKKLPLLKSLYQGEYDKAFLEFCNNHKRGFGLISSIQRFALSHDKALLIAKKIEGVYVDEKELVVYPYSSKEHIENTIKEIYTKNPYALLSAASIKLRIKWASEAFIKESLDDFVKSGFLKVEN